MWGEYMYPNLTKQEITSIYKNANTINGWCFASVDGKPKLLDIDKLQNNKTQDAKVLVENIIKEDISKQVNMFVRTCFDKELGLSYIEEELNKISDIDIRTSGYQELTKLLGQKIFGLLLDRR